MHRSDIKDYNSLTLRIQALKAERGVHEAHLFNDLNTIRETIENPAPFIKQTTAQLAADKDFRADLLKAGASLAINAFSNYLTKNNGKLSWLGTIFNKSENKDGADSSSPLFQAISELFKSRNPQSHKKTTSP